MPREVILNHSVAPFAEHEPNEQLKGQRLLTALNSLELEPKASPSKPRNVAAVRSPTSTRHRLESPSKPSSAFKHTQEIEIIELSSSSDDDALPSKARAILSQTKQVFKPPQPTWRQDTPSGKGKQAPKHQDVYVISSSSDEDNTPIRGRFKAPKATPVKDRILTEPATAGTPTFLGPDIKANKDGTIDYIPTPRRPINLSPSKTIKRSEDEASPVTPRPAERRRTLLQPDPIDPPREDLSWEIEQDESGGVRTGAMLIFPPTSSDQDRSTPSSNPPASPLPDSPGVAFSSESVASSTLLASAPSSPQKTPRRKKMPEEVAALHRLAIPYLKELDAKVFKNQLGASHLPEIEDVPASPTKGKGRNKAGIIWGMGSRGEFDDGLGSFIELNWSNRMATTAGRTEYKKTAGRQICIKIELGVKVVTTEERLRNTLAHEACHAASWAISGDFKQPHGATFKKWAQRVMNAFPDVEVATKHDYEIEYKYSWKCVNLLCGQIYKRHSNSINIEEHGCHCGSRLQPQFTLPNRSPRKAPTSQSKSAAFNSTFPRNYPTPISFESLAPMLMPFSSSQSDMASANTSGKGSITDQGLVPDDSTIEALTFSLKSTIL